MKFGKITREEYESFLETYPQKTFLHSSNFGEIRAIYGWEYEFLGLKKGNNLIAATMLMSRKEFLGKKEFIAIRGFLIDYDNLDLLSIFVNNIKNYVKSNGGFILRIDPYLIKQERDINGDPVSNGKNNFNAIANLKKLGFVERDAEQAKWMFALDLKNKTIDELLKNMKSNTRNLINRTFKEGIVFRDLSFDELDKFLRITDDTSERRHFVNKDLIYYQTIFKLFEKKNEVRFVVAELIPKNYLNLLQDELSIEENILNKISEKNIKKLKNQKEIINTIKKKITGAKKLTKEGDKIILSAAMFFLFGDEIVYFSSGNYKQYMNFYAQYRIQYEMIKYGVENGFKTYNFYGISGVFDKKDKRYGVYEFKKGFNGYVVELIGEYKLPIKHLYYLAYNIKNYLKNKIKKIIRRH